MINTTARRTTSGSTNRLSFRDSEGWAGPPGTEGMGFAVVCLGDEHVGPFLALAALPPMTEPPRRTPAHGHDCASWRISLEGTLSMGRNTYGPGQFRFQEGGKPYGEDDYAWGPRGGWSAVMMADRRGLSARPVDASVAPHFERAQADFLDWAGMQHFGAYHGAVDVATSLGSPRGGRVEGDFRDTSSWTLLPSGVRLAVGLVGDHERGPVVVALDCPAGSVAWSAPEEIGDWMFLVTRGSGTCSDDELVNGDIALDAGPCSDVLAGPDGLGAVLIIGDRSALPDSDSRGETLTALLAVLNEVGSCASQPVGG